MFPVILLLICSAIFTAVIVGTFIHHQLKISKLLKAQEEKRKVIRIVRDDKL